MNQDRETILPDAVAAHSSAHPRILNALVLDDSQFDRKNILRLCRKAKLPITVEEISSISQLDAALERTEFDVIMIDYSLPQGDGLQALAKVRNHPAQADCATIMVTGFDQTDLAVTAMKAGCDDYIAKDSLSPERIKASVLMALAGRATTCADAVPSEVQQGCAEDQLYPRIKRALQGDVVNLIREMHALRDNMADPRFCPMGQVEAIEHHCIALWRRLAAPEMITQVRASQGPGPLNNGPDQTA